MTLAPHPLALALRQIAFGTVAAVALVPAAFAQEKKPPIPPSRVCR